MSGAKGFEPSTSWSRNSVPKILKAFLGVAYVKIMASFSLSIVPKLDSPSTIFHDYRYIFVTADPSGMRATSVELGERSFNVQPSEGRTSEAQIPLCGACMHQWLWDYSREPWKKRV